MKFKGTTALLAIFVILGTYVYFSEYRGKEARQKQEEQKKKAVNVDEKDISEISLIFPDHTITGVKKGDKQWEITEPAGIEADSDEWDLLASNVPRIEREDTITANATDLDAFGLKSPALRVVAKTKDGKTIDLAFGAENPRKIYNYAKFSNSNEVFLSPSSWVRIFQKTLTDLRNKKVLDFEADDVDSVTIDNGTAETQLQKNGTDWEIRKPIDAKADNATVSSFISSIKFARATEFADASVDAKAAGLQPPAVRITLHDSKANANRELEIGKSSETDKYYAKDASRPVVMILDKEINDKAKQPLLEWRDKSIAHVDREKIDQIEVHRGSDTLALKKDGSDWKLPDGKKLEFDKVSTLLNTLDFDKVKDILDSPGPLSKYGLEQPRMEVVFKQGATELEKLSFGADSKTPEGIYMKVSNAPAVNVVGKDVFDKFNVKAEDLVEAKPAETQK